MNILTDAFIRSYGHLFGKGEQQVFESHWSLNDSRQRISDLLQSEREKADFSSKFIGSVGQDFVHIQYAEREGSGVGSSIKRGYTMFRGIFTQNEKGGVSLVGSFTVPMHGKLIGSILAIAFIPIIFIDIYSLFNGSAFSPEMLRGPLVGFFAQMMLALRQGDVEEISNAVSSVLE